MATTRIYGAEGRPSQPSFYIPNRVDEESLAAIVKAMGGAENVAFMVEEVLKRFLGTIEQIPPAFSACKVDGKRAYDLARKGEEVELKAKTLVIDEIELLECDLEEMVIKIRVVCSKGTYIRALARDIGQALDSGAHLIGLCRTRVGEVRLEDCLDLETFPQWLDEQQIETTINQ